MNDQTKEQINLPIEYEQSEEIQQLITAEKMWLQAAQHQDDEASIMAKYGDTSTHTRNAKLYLRVAQTIRMEIETGKTHCVICLGDHPDHLHMFGQTM
jgi:hypothetical protein